MTIKRMEHIGVVVEDLASAVAFFVALGMELEGEMPVEGPWVDRIVGLDGIRADVAVVRTPDGHGKLELTKFHEPVATTAEPGAPANVPGIRHILFAVDDLEDTIDRLRPHGAELIGEVVRIEDSFLLCYLRGPEGIIVELAEELR